MKVSTTNIIHHRGDPLLETFEYRAYCDLTDKDTKKARRILTKAHYDQYWTGIRNATTTEYVVAVYADKGEKMPRRLDAKPAYVKEAVKRRVDYEIAVARDIIAEGCQAPPAGRCEGDIVRLRDGHNRAAIQAAMGATEIEVQVGR